MIIHGGLIVSSIPTERGTTVFAELVPAGPLVFWARFDHGWRKWWPLARGRVWHQAHIRWWYEIIEDGEEYSTHHWRHDGGGITLRQALAKAGKAVRTAADEIDQEGGDVGSNPTGPTHSPVAQ